ncbi:MAG TPA: amidase [Thermomicrobiaceae bacterium]|nr:amidase [Thermomicrobiaceae bacterium]
MSAPWELTAGEIVAGCRAGELRAAEVVESFLDRSARLEPAIAAWATLDPAGALAEARALDAAAARGDLRPLQGIPFGVKDIIDVRGLPTEAGFAPYAGRRAARDAAIVAQLRALGAIPLGKTHTTQFANGDPAPTFNPFNREHTPGGSSAGSGAAVAARMTPAALGTQTAGSVLRPAAYNGVTGFKPTFNWFSRAGVLPLAWSLDHLGLLVRTSVDAALLYHALAESVPESAPAAPRIGLVTDFLERSQPAVAAQLEAAAGRLRDAGARVEPVRLPVELDLLLAVHAVIMSAEVAAVHAEALNAHPDDYGPWIRAEIEAGQLIPAAYDIKARRLRRRLGAVMDRFLAGFDALLLPTASNTPPGRESTGDRTCQAPWSLLGTPAISLPTALSPDRLPIGSQLVARRGADSALLALAGWVESVLGLIPLPELDS